MTNGWDRNLFQRAYVAAGGSPRSAASYGSYLARVDRVLGGLSTDAARRDGDSLIRRAENLPMACWGGSRERKDSISALRKFIQLSASVGIASTKPSVENPAVTTVIASLGIDTATSVLDILRQAQWLGAEYYRLTGKPLGITGEVAEYEAARLLNLRLCAARTPGHDAIESQTGLRIQIKGRAVDAGDRYRGMCPAIKYATEVDAVLLTLLDRATLTALEIWRADIVAVKNRIAGLTADQRRRDGTLAITQFKSIASLVYSR